MNFDEFDKIYAMDTSNYANILALGARFTPYEEIISIVKSWLDTDFEGGRHLDRVNKIENVL